MGRTDIKQERMIHIDCLRILACFSVLMLHSAAQHWYGLPVSSTDWLVINSYDAVVRFGVPIFVMISGALFLVPSKEIKIRTLYTHNIFRLVVLYFVWSAVYGLFDCRGYDWSTLKIGDILIEIYNGRYHLWYLPMLIGIYMLLPVLKKWVAHASQKEIQYFLLLFLIFTIGQNTIMSLKPTEWLGFFWGAFDFGNILEYPAYFVLGYYIVHYGIEGKWHKWIYLGGVLGACANVLVSNYKALAAGAPNGAIYDSFNLFTFLIVVAIFLFFVAKVSQWKVGSGMRSAINEISMATLGIYLMHLLWMELLQSWGIDSMLFSPVIGVPLCAFICFVICFFCAALLRRIPVIGKFLC